MVYIEKEWSVELTDHYNTINTNFTNSYGFCAKTSGRDGLHNENEN